MKKQILAGVLAASMIFGTTAFAAFSDLSGSNWDWARTAVEEMSENNIIMGYEDGTFRPERSVSKAEALVLMSRIVGFTQESSSPYVAVATQTYSDLLSRYSTPYKSEVSYLLYRGVLSNSDVAKYVGNDVASQPLKRYEAAILLTKLSGNEQAALEDNSAALAFKDASSIPSDAVAYVKYVYKNNIMLGMDEENFGPDVEVSRAQMAMLLYRMIDNLNYEYVSGTLSSYTESTDTIRINTPNGSYSSYSISSSIPVRIDGEEGTLADITLGANVRITTSSGNVVFVESTEPEFDETVDGIFAGYEKLTDSTVIHVEDVNSGTTTQYRLSPTFAVTYNGAASTITDLKSDDYVKLQIKDGEVAVVQGESKSKTIKGTVTDIILEPQFQMVISVDGVEESYDSADSVSVRRNGTSAELYEVLVGDSVEVTLLYGQISEIKATSKSSTTTGYLSEIRISNTPSIVLRDNNDRLKEYEVLRDIEIERNGSEAEIYDLRVGDKVVVSVEGDTVTKMEITAASEGASITGKIEYVNTSYGYIKLYDVPDLIFIQKARVTDSAGKESQVRSLKEDMNVTVFGTQKPGSYEASLVVVNG